MQVMRLAKLKYIVTSHSPFHSPVQLRAALAPPPPSPRYRAALEVHRDHDLLSVSATFTYDGGHFSQVDSLLEGDWPRVLSTLREAGEEATLQGVGALVRRCVAALRPEYVSDRVLLLISASFTDGGGHSSA
jgi:hypothetical protein